MCRDAKGTESMQRAPPEGLGVGRGVEGFDEFGRNEQTSDTPLNLVEEDPLDGRGGYSACLRFGPCACTQIYCYRECCVLSG